MSNLSNDARATAIQTVYRPYRTYGSPRFYEEGDGLGMYAGDAYAGGGKGLSPDSIAALVGGAASIFGPLVGKIGQGKQNQQEIDLLNKQIELEQLRSRQGIQPIHIGLGLGLLALAGLTIWAVRK